MKKQILFAGFLLLMLIPFASKAEDVWGADITWKKTGIDTYLVSLSVYRDCSAGTIDNQGVTILNCKGNVVKNIASATRVYGKDITPVCKTACTQCGSTINTYPGNTSCKFQYGIEKFIYQQQVVFDSKNNPMGCCDFKLTWGGDSIISSIRRNYGITTGAAGEYIYIEATLNRCDKYNNSSPVFAGNPLLMVCSDQCISYNPGVQTMDVDTFGNRDSLLYSLYAPMQDAKKKTTWSAPYDYYKPLKFDSFPNNKAVWNPPSCAGFHLDFATGTLNFKAIQTAFTIIAFKVAVYGKDATGKPYKKSEIARDMQLTVIKCPTNHIPTLSGIDGTAKTDTNICAGNPICFTLNSDDPDRNDTVTFDTTTYLTTYGATFTAQKNVQHPYATFCWTPDTTMISSIPYQLFVAISDDACPLSGKISKAFRIYVHPADKDSITISPPNCGDVNFSAAPKKGSTITTYLWSGDDSLYSTASSFKHHYKTAGTYKYKLTVSNGYGCGHTDSGVIVVPFSNPATPTVVSFSKDSLASSVKANAYTWYRDSLKIADTTQMIYTSTSGKYQVQITDSNGCISDLSSPYIFTFTGINNASFLHLAKIYPNPTTGILTIETPGIKDAQLSVMNITGQVQFQSVINEKADLNLHSLSSGIYLLRIQSKDGVLMERVVKE